MASNREQLKKQFPLPAYNYRVRIGGESHSFSQVSGLSFQYETITYRHGLSVIEGAHHMVGALQPINISLERGIIPKGSILLEWISNVHFSLLAKQDITIDLCDEAGTPLVSWVVVNALPTGYETSAFEADSNEIALETLTLIASNMQVTYHSTEQKGGTQGSSFI